MADISLALLCCHVINYFDVKMYMKRLTLWYIEQDSFKLQLRNFSGELCSIYNGKDELVGLYLCSIDFSESEFS